MAWDKAAFYWVNHGLAHPWLDPVMRVITYSGSMGLIWVLLAAYLLWRPRSRDLGLEILAGLLLWAVTAEVFLKDAVARPRPFRVLPAVRLLVPPPAGYSFPSGHAGSSAVAASLILFAHPFPAGVSAVVYALLIGLSRVYVGVHYPSDVLGGFLLGFLEALFIRRLFRRALRQRAAGSIGSTSGRDPEAR